MPLTSLLLGQDSMLMLFIYAGFHNRQLARTRLDCDLRTPSLVEYPTLLLATQTYQRCWRPKHISRSLALTQRYA